ncbi:NAD-glutamate dehydrogenase domain-containing protein, partial [Methylobacterium radiotolerans]|uniref:NAD-glutamate dehydrogenase domain-containing protein n=1 Tax=Methylobacterium radiotolerans TaxID=31998 RepID=UPI001180521B
PMPEMETEEARAFLEWLTDGQFLILGMQEHGIAGDAHPLVEGSSLGVLRDPGATPLRRGRTPGDYPPGILRFPEAPAPLTLPQPHVQATEPPPPTTPRPR